MSAPFDPPKLNPWPFVLADVILLGVAYWVGTAGGFPASPAAIWAVVVCVGLGAILLGVPFVVNYTRRMEMALSDRQKEIGALAETTASSAEQIGIAVAGLTQVVEAAHRATKQAEHLPLRLQEKVNEFKAQINEVAVTENEALAQELNTLRAGETERLEALFDRIQKLTTEWLAAEQQARLHWESSWRKAEHQIAEALSQLTHEAGEREKRRELRGDAEIPEEVKAETSPSGPPKTSSSPLIGAEVVPLSAQPPAEKRNLEKPSSVDFLSVVPDTTEGQEPVTLAAPKKKSTRRGLDEGGQPHLGLDLGMSEAADLPSYSFSSDRQARVLATAYIGIGNRLFVRGRGAGLSVERGTPMQFVSIGKWRWEAGEVAEPLTLSFWKNDLEPASNQAELVLDPGQQVELKLIFQPQ